MCTGFNGHIFSFSQLPNKRLYQLLFHCCLFALWFLNSWVPKIQSLGGAAYFIRHTYIPVANFAEDLSLEFFRDFGISMHQRVLNWRFFFYMYTFLLSFCMYTPPWPSSFCICFHQGLWWLSGVLFCQHTGETIYPVTEQADKHQTGLLTNYCPW